MVSSYNFGHLFIYYWEWVALPIYLAIILFIARSYSRAKIEENPVYKYYQRGLFIKLGGAIIFASIYYYYYKGGDTFSYFESAMVMKNTMFQSFTTWFRNEFGQANDANFSLFNDRTGYPLYYMYTDSQTFTVIRLINPIMLLTFNGYLITTVVISWLAYAGIWRLFLVFSNYYPSISKQLFIGIVCFPSVLFWSSGILKDTITLTCTGWAVYSVYNAFILRKRVLRFIIVLLICFYLILLVKPYIVLALLPGTLIWIFSQRIYRIRSFIVKLLIIPFIFTICFAGAYYLFKNLGGYLGKFSLEKIEKTAMVTSNDLKQSYYGGHSFDIGPIESSPSGYAKIFPKAFVAGAYRPFLWEAGNFVMLLSGVENIFLLYLTIVIIFKSRFKIFSRVLREPLLFFALSYSIFFAFSLGITTSNFGALVRFRVAFLPFFASALYILYNTKSLQPNTTPGKQTGSDSGELTSTADAQTYYN